MAEQEKQITTKEKQELSKPQEQTRPGRYYVPDVNICEFDDALKLWAEMPGVKEKDLDVTLNDGVPDGSVIAETLVKNGFRLKLLREEEIDLEDVFMAITKGITN